MGNGGDTLRKRPPPIHGGSVGEADLPLPPGVTWGGRAKPSASPLVEGVRRLRRSSAALLGAGIVLVLLVVAIFAAWVASQKPGNILFLVGAAFSMAASAFFPAIKSRGQGMAARLK